MMMAANTQPHGELWIDEAGEAHFLCHTVGDDFTGTRTAIEKFIAVLQRQLDNEARCPLFAAGEEQHHV